MYNKNSQIRAYARHLLDDNIFGKDWLKGALSYIFLTICICGLGLGFGWGALIAIRFIFGLAIESIVLKIALAFIAGFIPILVLYAFIGPVQVGIASVYIDLVRNGENIRLKKFFYGFKNFFSNALLGIMYVLQVVLWSFFFIIPGIYVFYSYALAFHVKRDHPNFRWKQCLDESERLMEGNRWRLFKLQISHLGWFIVGLAFVGIGCFWAEPYFHTSTAIFYEEVKASKAYH